MGNLTANFSSEEFVVSSKHPDLLKEISITPMDELKFFFLARMILQPLRDRFNRSLYITSGKRSPLLNQLIGGVWSSQHRYRKYDAAVDFEFRGPRASETLAEAFELLAGSNHKAWGQLIIYEGKEANTWKFIHASLPNERLLGEMWVKNNKGLYISYEPQKDYLQKTDWSKKGEKSGVTQ